MAPPDPMTDRDRNGLRTLLLFVALAITWTAMGCAARLAQDTLEERIDSAIRRYEAVAPAVNLHDPKERVLSLLEPSQADLMPSARKPADHYLQNGAVVEIFYFRSRRFPDGLSTDDEFTPYVFRDGKLVAIGWATLGGPKSVGQTVPQTNVQTNVDVHPQPAPVIIHP